MHGELEVRPRPFSSQDVAGFKANLDEKMDNLTGAVSEGCHGRRSSRESSIRQRPAC